MEIEVSLFKLAASKDPSGTSWKGVYPLEDCPVL